MECVTVARWNVVYGVLEQWSTMCVLRWHFVLEGFCLSSVIFAGSESKSEMLRLILSRPNIQLDPTSPHQLIISAPCSTPWVFYTETQSKFAANMATILPTNKTDIVHVFFFLLSSSQNLVFGHENWYQWPWANLSIYHYNTRSPNELEMLRYKVFHSLKTFTFPVLENRLKFTFN